LILNKICKISLIPTTLAALLIAPILSVYAQSSAPLNDVHFVECNSDGRPFFDSLLRTAEHFDDYQVESNLIVPKTDKAAGASLFFKKDDLVKIIVRSNGVKNGSIVVKQPNGKILAAGGPHLRFLRMTLSDDSRLLQLPNGYNAIKSDLLSLLLGVKQAMLAGSMVKVTTKPIPVDWLHQNVHILEVTGGGASGLLTDRIFIDPKTNVPIEWDIFRDGSILSTATFNNFHANIGLKDDFFKL
jgi:outer membrane lipoprotein-sorting protein